MAEKTILYMGEFSLPDKNAAAHRVLNNAKALRDLGYKIVFIDIDTEINTNVHIYNTRKNIQEFECYSIQYPKSKKKWVEYLFSTKEQQLIINNIDDICVIIGYNIPSIAMYRLAKICRKKNIRLISDCTEWHHTSGKGVLFDLVKNIDTMITMRWVNKRLDGIIVISSYLNNYYGKGKNVILIPPLVDIQENKWKQGLEADNKFVTLVYSGSPGKHKDKINDIVDLVMEVNNDVRLKIVGIEKEQYINNYSLINQNIDDKCIQFYGRVDHISALNILKSGDFAIFIREDNRVSRAGFPTKFVESITCGVPVITNATSDIDKYLEHGVNGFFLTDNVGISDIVFLSIDHIKDIKKAVNNKVFDYRGYIHVFKEFLNNIE